MIGWQNPAAFWALLVLAAPILIHLLRRHRAVRVPFPSLRFVPSAQVSATRIRRLSDPLLLALRLGALAMAVIALARPVLVTSSRVNGWNASTARALVVDVSASMRADGGDRARQADEMAEAEAVTATYARRFDVATIRDGLARAAAWLETTPPSRREIVVISDVQRGAIDAPSIASVPDTAGFRVVSVGSTVTERRLEGFPLLSAGTGDTRTQSLQVTADATAVTIARQPDGRRDGIRIVPAAAADALLRIAARAGAFAGDRQQPMTVLLSGAESGALPSSLTSVRDGWMLRAVLRLQESLAPFRDVAPGSPARDVPGSSPWTTVLANGEAKPIVVAAASGDELILDVAAPSDSLFAAQVVRAALNARVTTDRYRESEIARTDSVTLNAWTRPAPPVDRSVWHSVETTDARWCWLLSLIFLGAEQWLRGRSTARSSQEVARAA